MNLVIIAAYITLLSFLANAGPGQNKAQKDSADLAAYEVIKSAYLGEDPVRLMRTSPLGHSDPSTSVHRTQITTDNFASALDFNMESDASLLLHLFLTGQPQLKALLEAFGKKVISEKSPFVDSIKTSYGDLLVLTKIHDQVFKNKFIRLYNPKQIAILDSTLNILIRVKIKSISFIISQAYATTKNSRLEIFKITNTFLELIQAETIKLLIDANTENIEIHLRDQILNKINAVKNRQQMDNPLKIYQRQQSSPTCLALFK